MSQTFVARAFDRWARKERIPDASLLAAIEAAEAGLVDANLRGCLVKLRVARPGEGKRSGYRTVVAYRVNDKAFFLYGFGKNDRANIDDEEAEGYEEYGAILLALSEKELAKLTGEGRLRELKR